MIFLPALKKALRAVESGSQKPTGNDRADRIARFTLEARERFKKYLSHKSVTDAMFGQSGLSAIGELLVVCATDCSQKEFDSSVYKHIGAVNEFLKQLGEAPIKF